MSAEHAFVTLTLGRICAAQGKLAQAKHIYELLLSTSPHDTQLERELEHIDQRLQNERNAQDHPVDWVRLAISARGLDCQWAITNTALKRARMVLEADGCLTLRCASFPFDPGLSLRDTNIQSQAGSWHWQHPGGALFAAASVGLLSKEGKFVSMAHCRALALDGEAGLAASQLGG